MVVQSHELALSQSETVVYRNRLRFNYQVLAVFQRDFSRILWVGFMHNYSWKSHTDASAATANEESKRLTPLPLL